MSKEKMIKVYSTKICPYCNYLKDYLREKKIDFQEIDVTTDPKAQQEMIDKSGQMGVPVTIIKIDGKEEIVNGFDKEKINQILAIKEE